MGPPSAPRKSILTIAAAALQPPVAKAMKRNENAAEQAKSSMICGGSMLPTTQERLDGERQV